VLRAQLGRRCSINPPLAPVSRISQSSWRARGHPHARRNFVRRDGNPAASDGNPGALRVDLRFPSGHTCCQESASCAWGRPRGRLFMTSQSRLFERSTATRTTISYRELLDGDEAPILNYVEVGKAAFGDPA